MSAIKVRTESTLSRITWSLKDDVLNQVTYVATHVMEDVNIHGAERQAGSSLLERFRALKRETAQPNWDLEGGPAIPQAQWRRAWDLVRRVSKERPGVGVPLPSPCGDGSIHLRWRKPDRWFEVEVGGGALGWSSRSPEGTYSHGAARSEHDLLHLLRKHFA